MKLRGVVTVLAVMVMLGGCTDSDPDTAPVPPWKAEVRADMEAALGGMPLAYLTDTCQSLEVDEVETPEDALKMMEELYGEELTPETVYGAQPGDFDMPEGATLRDVLYTAAEVLLEACAKTV